MTYDYRGTLVRLNIICSCTCTTVMRVLYTTCAQCWSACSWVCIQRAPRATTSGLTCTRSTRTWPHCGPPTCRRCSIRCRAPRSSRPSSASAPPPSSAAGHCSHLSRAPRFHSLPLRSLPHTRRPLLLPTPLATHPRELQANIAFSQLISIATPFSYFHYTLWFSCVEDSFVVYSYSSYYHTETSYLF